MKNNDNKENENDDNYRNSSYCIDRRTFVKLAGATIGVLTLGGLSKLVRPVIAAQGSLQPFIDPLPIPPVATPGINPKYPGADYYEMSIAQANHQFHSSLPTTPAYGIGGASYLGPTIVAKKNKKVVIKFINNLPLGPHLLTSAIDTTIMGSSPDPKAINWKPGDPLPPSWPDENRIALHLHGGKSKPDEDGHPRRWFSPMGSSQVNPYPESTGTIGYHTYEWSNEQPAAFLWYHDHAWGNTRFNPFAGMAAAYLLRDDIENGLINKSLLPTGPFDVPLVLQDKLLDLNTGAMVYPNVGVSDFHPKWIPEYFGNIPVINGVAYPFLNVAPRWYRLHIVNGSNARFYNIWLSNGTPLWIIGSDQGFMLPVKLTKLLIAPGERFDILVNFSNLPVGTVMLLKNDANAPYPDGGGGDPIPELMQFRVVNPSVTASSPIAPTISPSNLSLPRIAAMTIPGKPWKEIVLRENEDPVTGDPIEVLLDSQHFTDSLDKPLITEIAGAIDVWQFVNLTPDAHPMHLHLVAFKIINRQSFDVDKYKPVWDAWVANGRVGTRPSVDNYLIGSPRAPAPEENGLKDTAKAYPGEVLRIISKFDLPSGTTSGRYVSHCHILEHEENDMMFNFEVKQKI